MENKLVRHTPLLYSEALSEKYKAHIYFKCENLQRTNSFKIRGASHFCTQYITKHGKPQGFCTHSSGNHGKALAYYCKENNIPCTIVVPNNAPPFKIEAMQSLGATLVMCSPDTTSRLEAVEAIEKNNFVQVPPYNHQWIMDGQSTVAKEILTELPSVNGIIAPVGGGGLSGGISQVLSNTNSNVELILAEPECANDAYRSLKTGTLVGNDRFDTSADGLRANLGDKNFDVLRKFEKLKINTCSESDIESAWRYMLQSEKLVIEKSSATVVAILDQVKSQLQDKTWVLVLSGGNIDVSTLS